jgi:hypothetical protein
VDECRSIDLAKLMNACDDVAVAAVRARSLRQPLCPSAWLDFLADAGVRLAELDRQLSSASRELGLGGSKERMQRYLEARPGKEIPAAALQAVAGSREWPRRLRELREAGLPVEQRGNGKSYVLIDHSVSEDGVRNTRLDGGADRLLATELGE